MPRRRARCAAPPRPADVEHRALGQRPRDLVGARQHGVGAELQRAGGQVGVEAEVRAPALVDDERDVVGVRDAREPLDVGDHAVVRRRDDERRVDPRAAAGVRQRLVERRRRHPVGEAELLVELGGDEGRHAAREHQAVDDGRVRVALRDDPRPQRGERQAERVVALRRPVGQEERPRGPVGLGGQPLGLLVGCRRRAEVDPVDVLRHVHRQGALAQRVAEAGVGARAALVPGDVEAAGPAEGVADDRVEVRRGRLLGAHRPADRRSSARTKPSRSPSSTRWASPISWPVRWSLTIVYGCST